MCVCGFGDLYARCDAEFARGRDDDDDVDDVCAVACVVTCACVGGNRGCEYNDGS